MLLAAVGSGPARAQPVFSDGQRAEIGRIVKDYLVANPEVLQEAMTELERRSQEAQRVAQASALKESRETLTTSPHGNVFGNPKGDVTLVEFFDYNCGYCKRALADVRALMRSDPKLRVVMRDFPVLGPESVEASRVAVAVKQQLSGDKLFEFHAKLMESRGRVDGARAIAVAREMGLDMPRLQKDTAGADVAAALSENQGLGEKLGLTGTPAFIVGDEVISGAVGIEPLRQVIASVRKCGQAPC